MNKVNCLRLMVNLDKALEPSIKTLYSIYVTIFHTVFLEDTNKAALLELGKC